MDISEQFNSEVIQENWFRSDQVAIVAVSTGVDSMSLLTLMQQLPLSVRPKIVVAHVNHQLRQQSQVEERFINQYCQEHQIERATTRWPMADHPKRGIEAAARRFRYDFFTKLMVKYHASSLLTAHHADDQAETVLMKLVRGGQLAQLQGILPAQPFKTGQLIRPLLAFSKDQLRAYAKQHQLTWFEDETNDDDNVLRNRIRHQLIPGLKQENPAFLAHVKAYSDQLTAVIQLAHEREEELLSQISDDAQTYSVDRWRKLSAIQQRFVLKTIFRHEQIPIKEAYLDEAVQLLKNDKKPNGQLNLAHSQVLEKDYHHFSIKAELKVPTNDIPADKIVVISNQWVRLSRGLQVRLMPFRLTSKPDRCQMALNLKPAELPLQIRQARPVDQVKLASGGHKSVRRILIDHKVPQAQRSKQLVAVSAKGEILWLIGLQRSARDFSEPNYELVVKQSD